MAAVFVALGAAPAHGAERTYTLYSKAFELGGFETKLLAGAVPKPPVEQGHLTYMYARLVDEHGARVRIRQVMLHHVVFMNYGPAARAMGGSCSGVRGQPFYGTGEEHQALRLPPGYGYPISPGDTWRMGLMLMSHHMAVKRVRVEYRVRVSTGRALKTVNPYWLRTTGCRSPEYEVHGGGGPGSTQLDSFVWKAPISGRLVAAGGHVHGGAHQLRLTEPNCEDRVLADTDPWYGLDSHPVYKVFPQLHEPGPIATRSFLSKTGIPVRKGQLLRLLAIYDNERQHPQAMAIMHLYITPGEVTEPQCAPLPQDARSELLQADSLTSKRFGVPGRLRSPPVKISLVGVGEDGLVAPLPSPRGRTIELPSGVTNEITDNSFEFTKVKLPLGGSLIWAFRDPHRHNVVLANGPWSAGAPLLSYRQGDRYKTTFPRPGRYQLFCQFHPLTMHQQVTVEDDS